MTADRSPTTRDTHPDSLSADPSDRFGHLFHLIDDAVVEIEIADTTPVVRAVNAAFEDIFGYDRESVLGNSLNEFIIPDVQDTEATSFDERTAAGKANHAIVQRQTAMGIREFLYRGIPYEREDGRQFGFAIYSDITEQRTYERHIHVIHRILRHNLRNELTVILGAAAMLESHSEDPKIRRRAEQIRQHARNLSTIGKEAQTLERILTADRQPQSLDLVPFCRQACEAVRRNTAGGHISLDAPERLRVSGVPELQTAIEGLIENAVIHNSDEPTVHVRARYETKRIIIEIADDGPGIPDSERAPVFDNDDITQLQHGTGLGLWLARCIIEVCDGHLEYDRTDDDWTVLRLSLRPA